MRAKSGLELTIAPIDPDAIGSRLRVLVRPEHIRLADMRGEQTLNRIQAEINDFTYLGEDVHLRVTAPAVGELLVSLKSGKATRRTAARRARSSWRSIPSDVHVLRK